MSHLQRVQLFESLLKKRCSILWVIFQTGSNISVSQNFCTKIFKKWVQFLWVKLKKKVQFCELYSKKGFNSVSYIQKNQFLETSVKKKVGFFESYFFLKKNSILWVVSEKSSILWVVLLKSSIRWVMWKKRFNSFNHIGKRFNSVGHIQEKGSIHWDILKKKFNSSSQVEKTKQFFTSESKNFHSLRLLLTQGSILWVILLEKVQFFESILRKLGLNSLSPFLEIRFNFWVNQKKKINSLSHVGKQWRFNSSRHIEKKGSLLWVKGRVQFCESCWKEGFTSVSDKKSSILWVFFVSKNSILWVMSRKGSILWVIFLKKEVQFCESCKKKSSILWVILKSQFVWVFLRRAFFPKVEFFESYSKRGSILWVILQKEEGSTLKKKHFFELHSKKVQFFESIEKNNSNWEEVHKRGSNSMSRLQRVQSFESLLKKKGSILWVIFPDRINHFCESNFFFEKIQLFESFFFRFHFFESYKTNISLSQKIWSNSLSQFFQKKNSLS